MKRSLSGRLNSCAHCRLQSGERAIAAIDAYIYAYPLVTMELTRRVMTNVEKSEGSKAPMGQFARCATST